MGITRRMVASMLGASPFVGKEIVHQGMEAVKYSQLARVSASGLSGGYAESQPCNPTPTPVVSRMPSWRAAQIARKTPIIGELMERAAWEENRYVTHIDPDLLVLRSFSPMAKLTFQRQRNVQRQLEMHTTEPFHERLEPLTTFVRKLCWGN